MGLFSVALFTTTLNTNYISHKLPFHRHPKQVNSSSEDLKAQFQSFSSKFRRQFDDDLEEPIWDDNSDAQRKAENTPQGQICIEVNAVCYHDIKGLGTCLEHHLC